MIAVVVCCGRVVRAGPGIAANVGLTTQRAAETNKCPRDDGSPGGGRQGGGAGGGGGGEAEEAEEEELDKVDSFRLRCR